ncbi:hypothetical protein [Roseateles sp.]|uniref:hypothetical protein n=1 Tax=Roseateles sp. TaxID=1971397 RepID=UPI0025CFF4EE|nr:hypothetical protein [Roseateles sp.]MBV8035832.1 hypothetical protein [Roseateles sp.]
MRAGKAPQIIQAECSMFAGQGYATVRAFDKHMNKIASASTDALSNRRCQPGYSCAWTHLSLDTPFTAYSIEVDGAAFLQFVDDLSFLSLGIAPDSSEGTVPEPGWLALSLAALGALGWTRPAPGARPARRSSAVVIACKVAVLAALSMGGASADPASAGSASTLSSHTIPASKLNI